MTTTAISLNKLLAWDGNVRKTDSDKAISELAASIARMDCCNPSSSARTSAENTPSLPGVADF